MGLIYGGLWVKATAMAPLGALQKAVEEVTGPAHKSGCRVIVDAKDQSIRVYDLHRWTYEYTELLQFLRPHARVTVHSSSQSLSGFLIYITEANRPQYLWLRVCAMGLVLGALVLMVWWVHAEHAKKEAEPIL
jgi:hypothetical protein